jgi:hypothetical protein
MTAPTLDDYQIGLESTGLVFGAATNYILKSWRGLGVGGYRDSLSARPFNHGITAGPEYRAETTVEIDLHLRGTSADEVVELADALISGWYIDARATAEYGVMDQLHVKLPGQEQRFVKGRPRRSSADPSNFHNGWAPASVQFLVTDPTWYSSTLHSQAMNLSAAPSGRGFNKSFDYGWGGTATAGAYTITNLGAAPTKPVLTLVGPLTNPTLTNETTGEELELTYTLGSGEILEVDFDAATILLNGTASRYYAKTGGFFWELVAGANTVRFSAQSGSGTATLEWRDAWL